MSLLTKMILFIELKILSVVLCSWHPTLCVDGQIVPKLFETQPMK